MKRINLRENKGVTLSTLVIAILLMTIITSIIIYNTIAGANTRALNNMYNDITILKDRIDVYYSKYGTIPVLEGEYTNIENIQNINSNDNDKYYVIDLEALENLTLTHGDGYTRYKQVQSSYITDLYVINEQSHNIYYVRGIVLDGNTYYTLPGDYTKVNLPEWSDTYTVTKKNNYTDTEGNSATIPAGFQVSLKEGENKVSTGLVVRNAQDLNEFVWIPVENMGYKYDRYAFLTTQPADGIDEATNSLKIKQLTDSNYYFTEAISSDETESIEKYGGYYIGRYETGIEGYTAFSETSDGTTNWTGYTGGNLSIQKGKQVWNYITRDKAKEVAEGLYTDAENGVISKLCSSYAWDTALKFIQTNYSTYPTNSTQGNYSDTEFTYTDLDGNSQTKANGEAVLVPTGQTTAVNNIYDMGGNVYEFTTEINNNTPKIYTVRGGYYNDTYTVATPAWRATASSTDAGAETGFRVALFIGDNIYGNPDALAIKAKPGDYVKYDTGIDGIGDNQDGILTFRVLYNDSTYGLQIISDKNVEDVTLGRDGTNDLTAWQASINDYNNAIATLNQKAERYAESSPYAIDGRCVGSVPTVGIDGKFNAKNTENVGPFNDFQFTPSSTIEGVNDMKDTDTNYETDQTAMQAIGGDMWTTGEWYWLASRIVYSYVSSCSFDVRRVDTSGSLGSSRSCEVHSDGNINNNAYVRGLRPCISINPNVKVIGGGDGSSEEQAYELGI
mgnify:FL=1